MPVLALIAALALSPTPAASESSCVRLGGSATHYYPIDDRTIVISSGLRAYRVTTSPSSLLADRSAVILSRFQNSTVVCNPLDLNLRVTSPSGTAGLITQRIEQLSSAQAESLRHGGPGKDRDRPGLNADPGRPR